MKQPLLEKMPFVNDARQLRRRVRRWWSHRRTDAYILSYPGCGRTWLAMLLGGAVVDHLGLDADPGVLHELYEASRAVPRMKVSHDGDPQLTHVDAIERDKRRFASKTVILMVRDPRDAVVSYYFEGSKRRGRVTGSLAEFVRSPVGSLDSMIAYMNIWAENRDLPRRFCLVRYEDLKRDAGHELGRVMDTIGFTPSRDCLQRAVEFATFENMRKLETEGGTGHVGLARVRQPGAAQDAEALKTRKGKIGGYRDYLSEDDIAYVNQRIDSKLSPFFRDYHS